MASKKSKSVNIKKYKKKKELNLGIFLFAIVFIPYFALNRIIALGDYEIAIRTNMTEQILFTLSSLPRDCLTALNTMYSEFSNYFFEMVGGWNTIQILLLSCCQYSCPSSFHAAVQQTAKNTIPTRITFRLVPEGSKGTVAGSTTANTGFSS